MSEAQTDADAYSVYEYMLWGTHRYSTGSSEYGFQQMLKLGLGAYTTR